MSILLELFDRATDWELLLNQRELFKAQFVINELKYEVVMDGRWTPDIELINPPELFNDIWEINFTVSGTANMDYYSQDKITGTGNAILVFSTVVDIVSHAVGSRNIQTLNFSADNSEPTRVKLYHRMATYFAKNGWRYIGSEEIRARSASQQSRYSMSVSDYILTKHPKPTMNA